MLTLPIITIRKEEQLLFLKREDILYCSAANGYVQIHLLHSSDRPLLSSCTMKEIEAHIKLAGFYRIHHKYLVNMAYLTAYNLEESNITLAGGVVLKIAAVRKKSFLDRFIAF